MCGEGLFDLLNAVAAATRAAAITNPRGSFRNTGLTKSPVARLALGTRMRHADLKLELLRRVVVRPPDPVVHHEASQQIDARLRDGSSDHDPAARMGRDHESRKWSQIPGRWSPIASAGDAQAPSSSCRVPDPQPARVLRVQRTNLQKHHWTINRASKRKRRHRNLARLYRQADARGTRVLRPGQRPRAAAPASDERCRHDQRKTCCSERPTQSAGLPFSLHRLIAEAKRRARQRRLLLAIAVAAVLAVAVVAAGIVARSPAASVSRSSAPGCAGKVGAAATPAASIGTRYALVRRDEVRMLCLILPPPGAQLLTREPAVMARLGKRFFGFPKPFAPFARHRFWRVHSPVATVVSFEQAHPPAGLSVGCGPPSDCGGGVLAGPNVPANASLQFTLRPIRRRVGSRALRMTILGLPGGWTAIRVDAVNRPWTRGA